MAPIVIDENARKKANLRVLQRLDSSIIDISGYASHVVLYEFIEDSQAWQKRNMEGSLFIAKRSDFPTFKLIVMNRNAKENMYVPLTPSFQMQVRSPYLIFRVDKDNSNKAQQIRGIWFHDENERETISVLLERIVKKLEHDVLKNAKLTTEQPKNNQRKEIDSSSAISSILSPLNLSDALSLSEEQKAATNCTVSSESIADNLEPKQTPILDKKSLQLSLMSLLQDERFLDLIHAQYLKVSHARSKKESTDKD